MTDQPKCGNCSLDSTRGSAGLSPGIPVTLGNGNCNACIASRASRPKEPTVWPGSVAELAAWSAVLLDAMKTCPCKDDYQDDMGGIVKGVTCSMHKAAVDDQRWLNGLVMMRRQRYRLLYEEGVSA